MLNKIFILITVGLFFNSIGYGSVKENTHESFKQKLLQFRKTRIDEYIKISQDPEDIKKQALLFFEAHDEYFVGSEKVNQSEVVQMARGLKSSNDPMLLCEVAHVMDALGNNIESDSYHAVFLFRKARDFIVGCKYSLYVKVMTYRRYVQFRRRIYSNYRSDAKEFDTYKELLYRWLDGSEFKDDQLRQVFWEVSFYLDSSLINIDNIASFCEQIEESKKLNLWLKYMILGRYQCENVYPKYGHFHKMYEMQTEYFEREWPFLTNAVHRHYGPPFVFNNRRSKSEKGRWEKGGLLKTARWNFKKAQQLQPDFPEAASEMIWSLHLQKSSLREARKWFDLAKKAERDSVRAYKYFISFLLHGLSEFDEELGHEVNIEKNDELDFIKEFFIHQITEGDYQTAAPFFIKDMIFMPSYENNIFKRIFNTDELYVQLQKILKGYESVGDSKPNFVFLDDLRSLLLVFALKLGNDDDVIMYWEAITSELNIRPAILLSEAGELRNRIRLAYARKSTYKNLADALYQTIDFSRNRPALAELQRLLKETRKALNTLDDGPVRQFFDTYKMHLWQEITYLQGEWVDLQFDHDMSLWSYGGGEFKVDLHNQIKCGKFRNEEMHFVNRAWFAGPYEVEVTIDFVTASVAQLASGISSGLTKIGKKEKSLFCYYDGLFGMAGYYVDDYRASTRGKQTSQRKIKLKCWDNYFEFFDETQMIMAREIYGYKPGHIGFGFAPNWHMAGRIAFTDFRVRKINYPFKPESDDIHDLISYYEKRIQSDATANYYFKLGEAYYQTGKYFKSLELAYEMKEKFPADASSLDLIGWNLFQLQDVEGSLDHLENALKSKTKRSLSYRLRAIILSACLIDEKKDVKKAQLAALDYQKLPRVEYGDKLEIMAYAKALNDDFEGAIKDLEMSMGDDDVRERGRKKGVIELYRKKKLWHYVFDEVKSEEKD